MEAYRAKILKVRLYLSPTLNFFLRLSNEWFVTTIVLVHLSCALFDFCEAKRLK